MEAATASQPAEPSPLSILPDQSAPSATQRTGNGHVVRFIGGRPRFVLTNEQGSVAGKRKPALTRRHQAEDFANASHALLLKLRQQMGLNQPITNESTNGQPVATMVEPSNGKEACGEDSRQSARAELKEAAGILVNLTRGWDTALERLRIERGVPDPGCRRPGEPMPKARKPTNRAPDSLACGSDTPTGGMPSK